MTYHVIYRKANGDRWHVFGGPHSRQEAARIASSVRQFNPRWTVSYKHLEDKFPGMN